MSMPNYEKPPPYAPNDPNPNLEGIPGSGAYLPQPHDHPIQSAPRAYIPSSNPIVVPNYGATTVMVTQRPEVIFLGGCPACKVGILEDDFTWMGICCAILFFPLGILCCLLLRRHRCANCGAVFG